MVGAAAAGIEGLRPGDASEQTFAELPAAAREHLRKLVSAHSDHPSIDLAFNASNRYFTNCNLTGAVPFRSAGRVVYTFTGGIAPPEERGRLLDELLAWAEARRRRVFGVQLRAAEAELWAERGFTINEMGRSYTLELPGFSLKGGKFMKLRNKLKQPRKAGVEVGELGREVADTPAVRAQIEAITHSWLRSKGRHVKLIDFLVGEVASVDRPGSRCFLAKRDGSAIAFITYVPVYGRYSGLMHDLTRRLPDAPPGTMELINVSAIERFRDEGVAYLNFGLTPLVGIDDRHPGHSRVVARVLKLLAEHGAAIYPAKAQVAYKMKWQPKIIEPEFIAFRGRFRLGYLWQLLRLTRSI